MNVPKLRFKEFNDEWIETKIQNVATVIGGGTPSTDEPKYWGNEINWFTPSEIGKTKYVTISNRKISQDGLKNSSAKLLPKGTILLSSRATVGEASILLNEASTNQGFQSLIVNENNCNEFIYYLKYKYKKEMLIKSFGSTFLEISKSNVENIKIKIPSKEEQFMIANFLSLLDKKIELQSKKIEDLKLFKKGLIYNEKRNNNSWNEYKISDIMNITRGIVIPKTEISECINNEFKYPVYSSQTSNNGILGYDSKYDFNGKFLTWTTDGANAGKVFYREGKFRCTNVCGILYNKDNRYVSELTAELLNIETPKYVSYVGNPKLMNNVMSNIIIKLPTPSRDNFFSSILKISNKKIVQEEEKIEKLVELKKGLMQNMFV